MHAVEDANVVYPAGHVGEEFGDVVPGFAVLFELPSGTEQPHLSNAGLLDFQFPFKRGRLAVVLFQPGLVVKRLHLGGGTPMNMKMMRLALAG